MRAYVGVTDTSWAAFLRETRATEANFWFPSAKVGFAALRPGEVFLFKTHYPHNKVVGGGFFEHYTVLRASEAWAFMAEGNGVASFVDLVDRVRRYRKGDLEDPDPQIGCVILNNLVFFERGGELPGPESFARSIVRGKGYPDPSVDSVVETATRELLAATPGSVEAGADRPINWTIAEARRRLGQGGFQAVVLDAYQARCAITGHRIRPTLQAAHIRPVTADGPHSINNGLLLRSDVHTLFDRGYLALDDHLRLLVSPRIRSEYGNGAEFYERAGRQIVTPAREIDRPDATFLRWHRDSVFLAG